MRSAPLPFMDTCGTIGVIAAGFLLWGYPSSPHEDFARITPWGQLAGAVIMFLLLGFLPCYVLAWVFDRCGVLRIPPEVELAGLDHELIDLEARQLAEIEADR